MKFKLLGVGMIVLGIIMGWYLVLGPLREAQNHAEIVKYSMKSFMVVPLAIACGFIVWVGGEKVWYVVHGTPQNAREWMHRLGLVAVVLLVAVLAWMLFDAKMTALGYVSQP